MDEYIAVFADMYGIMKKIQELFMSTAKII